MGKRREEEEKEETNFGSHGCAAAASGRQPKFITYFKGKNLFAPKGTLIYGAQVTLAIFLLVFYIFQGQERVFWQLEFQELLFWSNMPPFKARQGIRDIVILKGSADWWNSTNENLKLCAIKLTFTIMFFSQLFWPSSIYNFNFNCPIYYLYQKNSFYILQTRQVFIFHMHTFSL